MRGLGQNVVIKPIVEDRSESTLILPTSKGKYLTGTAVCENKDLQIKENDLIYYQPSGFIEIDVDGEKLHSVSYSSLIISL